MGGSGGSRFFPGPVNVERLKGKFRESEARTIDQAYESEVQRRLSELLAEYNDRDEGKTNAYLERIKKLLEEDIDGSLDLRFGGSVQKHTYVDGLSDVDCLVFLKDPELSKMIPKEVLNYFQAKLRERLRAAGEVTVGNLAVTVTYQDGTKIQLLPAIKKGAGLVISDGRGKEWSGIIRPDKFAGKLSEVNEACGWKVVPTIKLAKAAIYNMLGEGRLSGYHIESIAIEAFKSYQGTKTTKAMLLHFFDKAKDLVKVNIKDKTSQSVHVDDYLGPENNTARRVISSELDRISRRLKNADAIGSVSQWMKAIGE